MTKARPKPINTGTPLENVLAPTTFTEYQRRAHTFAVYPEKNGMVYCSLKLGSEAGEFQGKLGKTIRDGEFCGIHKDLLHELGDVLWYVSELSALLGVSLETVAMLNISKLQDRANRGVIHGSGDNR